MKLDALAQQFHDLLQQLRGTMELDDVARQDRERDLEAQYRQMVASFSKLDERQVAAALTQAQVPEPVVEALKSHMQLGRQQVLDIQRPIARLIQADPGRTDWAVSEFITTHSAYALIQDGRTKAGRKKAAELDERAARLLKGMLGVEGYKLSAEFAKKVRGELLAGAIGYAHARLCRRDMAAWKKDPSIRETYKDNVEDYLCDCISRASLKLHHLPRMREDGGVDIACAFAEHGQAVESDSKMRDGLGATAVKLQADCFCVNHEEKLFVVGSATTNASFDAKQLESLVRQVVALEQLAKHDPRYQGYQVRPFFLHSGYFCANAEGASGQGREFVEQMRSANMPQAQIEALSHMAFFNLLAEKHPHPEAGRIFCLTNPHIAGCNSLPLYESSEAFRAGKLGKRGQAVRVLGSLALALEAMASPAFDATKSGPRETLLHGAFNAMSNFHTLFPLPKGQAMPAAERKLLEKAATHMASLADKLNKAGAYGNVASQMFLLSRTFQNKTMLEEHVQFCATSGANKGHYHWSQDMHDELCNTKGVFNVAPDYIREHASNFLSSIHSGQMPALLARAMAYCQKDSQVVLGRETMIDRAQVALEELIGDHKKGYHRSATEYDGGMGNNASFVQSLRNEAAALEQSGQTGMGSTTFRLLASVFQMNHEELAGDRKSQAFDRNGPAFLQACLGSGDAELARMAVDVLGGVPNAALPSHRKSNNPKRR